MLKTVYLFFFLLPSCLVQNVTANHRINDTIANEDGPQTLTGRFMYGPLDMVTLTGEKVLCVLGDCHCVVTAQGQRWHWSVLPWSLLGFAALVSWPGSPAQSCGCLPPGTAFVTEVSPPRPGFIPAPDVWVLPAQIHEMQRVGSRTNPAATQSGSGGMSLCLACPAGGDTASLSPGGHPHHDPATVRRVGVL